MIGVVAEFPVEQQALDRRIGGNHRARIVGGRRDHDVDEPRAQLLGKRRRGAPGGRAFIDVVLHEQCLHAEAAEGRLGQEAVIV